MKILSNIIKVTRERENGLKEVTIYEKRGNDTVTIGGISYNEKYTLRNQYAENLPVRFYPSTDINALIVSRISRRVFPNDRYVVEYSSYSTACNEALSLLEENLDENEIEKVKTYILKQIAYLSE